ncbi:hypothetical protein FSP39_022104 [Pinctada imbricata]|uniref:Innexin n=1 Tax=Pinctada imbricata TaxID=66713 RepID=A0AA88Y3D7_PINIB|nr:hypothetical protein FSP39_022104 [Pinctada imbricata]
MSWVNNPLSSPGSMSVRLNNTWTVILLLVFGIVAFWLQIYKNPISCLTPKEFSPAYVLWTHNQCWYARRMYVEKKEDFLFYGEPGLPTVFQDDYREYSGSSDRLNDPRRTSLIVYQWIPVMILFQALLFKLPDLNVQRYQVVCNIPINYWYHLIVEAVRVWLLIVMIPTVLSCLIDAVKVVIPYFRQSFMSCYLSSMDRDRPQPNNTEVNLFASYMGQDIVILLKLIGNHTSEILVGDTVIGLWDIHHGSPPGVAGSYVPQTLPSAPGHGAHYDGKVEYASAPGENVPLVNVGGGGNLYPKA